MAKGKKKDKKEKKKREKAKKKVVRDKHLLYSAAVQSPDVDLDFFQRVYRKKRGAPFHRLREDFCGTAVMACEWVKRDEKNEAWGIDLDQPTLDWGRKRYVPVIGDAVERLHLIRNDVLEVSGPPVDVIAAQNFSYSVFKTRDVLLRYFRGVRKSLRDGGIFFLDILGGPESMEAMDEKRRIPSSKAFDGTRIPAFTYIWDQSRYNPVNGDFLCYIHFKLGDGTKMKKAFTYDWRLWTVPEVRDLMHEAGFAETEFYVEGWDDEADDTDGVFRRRKYFDGQSAWVAYVVGLT